ncbi:hypothetical protein [Streptomyces phaeochromogenes]
MDDHTFGPLHLGVRELTIFRPVALTIALVAVVLILRVRWSVLPPWACAPASAWLPHWQG